MMLAIEGEYSRSASGAAARMASATLLAILLASSGVAVAVEDAMQTLTSARFVQSAMPTPPIEGGMPVSLPDAWEVSRPIATGYGWYLLKWIPPSLDGDPSLFLTAATMPSQVYVNEVLVGSTGSPSEKRPSAWEQSRAILLPPGIVHAGVNRIAIRVHERAAGVGGMGPVLVGPSQAIRMRAYADLMWFVVGPAIISTTIVVLGLIIIMLWLRRRDPAYGLFGFAATLWGLHTAISLLPGPLLPQPHWVIWWHAVYMAFVGLLCLFCLEFAGVRWQPYRRFVIAFVILVAPILYAAAGFDALVPAAVYVRATAIGLVIVALAAVARYAVRIRNTESLLLLATGSISAALAVHDWLIAQNPLVLRPLWLVPYAALSFLLLVAWILVDRFVLALNESERLNTDLEQRVAEKSAALMLQLDDTRVARDASEAANRAKSRFLAAASHDLRQPLHALGLFTDALSRRVHGAEEVQLIGRINTSVASLESLLSALLDVSKLDAGVVEARIEPTPLEPLFERLAGDYAPEAIERGIKFVVVPTREVVESDPVLLERILRNLVANAMRYTQRGGVVMGCRRRGGRVGIEVWDSGPGVAQDERERIFEEFYQIGNPERDRSQGLGLGLAIVRRLAELLGHDIVLRSRMGRGSVFAVWVRRATHPVFAERALPESLTAPLRDRRVMFIDDEAPIREGMRCLLDSWGCRSTVAADPEEALAIAAGMPPPEALLVDYRLRGGMDGLRAIAQLRDSLGADIPAILISGESSVEELARIKDSGLLLLHKPVMPAKLRSALAFVLMK